MPERCSREILAEQFWGWRKDGNAKQNLRTALTQLRKDLEAEPVLGADAESVWLDPDWIGVDVAEFNALTSANDTLSLRAAAELYRGELLAGLHIREGDIERWIADERERYRARALDALVKLSEDSLKSGDVERAIADARRALDLDDLAEGAHRVLLEALLRANRRGDAMRHGMSVIELFERTLSVSPSPETMALIEKIRADAGPRPALPPKRVVAPPSAATPAGGDDHSLVEQRSVVALSYEIDGVAEAVGEGSDPQSVANLVTDLAAIVRTSAAEWLGLPGTLGPDHGAVFFGVDGDTEDHASDAVSAAIELNGAIAEYRWSEDPARRFGLTAGLDLGVSFVSRPASAQHGAVVTGQPEITARSICAHAARSTIVVSDRLRSKIGGYFRLVPQRGPAGTTTANQSGWYWQVTAPTRTVDRFQAMRRRVLPTIGRRSELDLLMSRWADAGKGNGQIVILRGDPGIGKSRLAHDFRGRLRASGARTWLLQCSPSGSTTPFSPLASLFAGRRRQKERLEALFSRAMRRLGAFAEENLRQFGVAIGVVDPPKGAASPSATRDAGRRTRAAIQSFVAAWASRGPVCLLIEDLHWADPSTLTELEALVRWIATQPVLIVATTREDALHSISAESNTLDLAMRRLDPEDSRIMATGFWEMLAAERPDPRQISLVTDFAEGVPLFLEELVLWRYREDKSLGPSPALRGGGWGGPSMPLSDLLLSRINRLGRAREVAQIAAVIGRSFDLSTLSELSGELLPREDLLPALELLVEQNILRQIWPPPEPEYEFRHALLREAVYGSLRDNDRRILHRRVFERLDGNVDAAEADRAWHAERAGDFRAAAAILARLGRDSAMRSAMTEASTSLRHALHLTESIDEIEARERLQLEIIAALGPVITSQSGSNNAQATDLYQRGVNIARQRPPKERAEWFAVFWGWWYTGSDFQTMHDRALRVQEMLAGVDDPEIVLQINHCIWAIDFNLGKHRETLQAIDSGLALYDLNRAMANRALFGVHDAKVCGLGQKALSLWLTGRTEASDSTLAEMIAFVKSIDHAPSTAHSFDTEAVSAFYRNDFEKLSNVARRMGGFADKYELEYLAGMSLLFGGWADARLHALAPGHATFLTGLEKLRSLGAVMDLPIYLDMQATLLALDGELDKAFDVLSEAITAAERSGHAYWLAELYRRRGDLASRTHRRAETVLADLRRAIRLALEQDAFALLTRAQRTIKELQIEITP
jgi:predicted ATPase/DNA-binding SARP family transcriptional activator